jgi:hypothetical protein
MVIFIYNCAFLSHCSLLNEINTLLASNVADYFIVCRALGMVPNNATAPPQSIRLQSIASSSDAESAPASDSDIDSAKNQDTNHPHTRQAVKI